MDARGVVGGVSDGVFEALRPHRPDGAVHEWRVLGNPLDRSVSWLGLYCADPDCGATARLRALAVVEAVEEVLARAVEPYKSVPFPLDSDTTH